MKATLSTGLGYEPVGEAPQLTPAVLCCSRPEGSHRLSLPHGYQRHTIKTFFYLLLINLPKSEFVWSIKSCISSGLPTYASPVILGSLSRTPSRLYLHTTLLCLHWSHHTWCKAETQCFSKLASRSTDEGDFSACFCVCDDCSSLFGARWHSLWHIWRHSFGRGQWEQRIVAHLASFSGAEFDGQGQCHIIYFPQHFCLTIMQVVNIYKDLD